ncbi:phosphoglycerate kinase [Candidatus Hecatella orcuttiae]|jgi:phosphoglycerate kinase|uniref:phosphoglycerate kinase n=1 Tax=Candidatus Hecatella orcuttiae TaxID=1935119 RepID=UPI002867C4BB|nr:phosphoglycerate kinase [Candidatus Hecatella orcuttiae]
MEYLTLNDVDTEDKTVFLRLDINVPINPETGQILNDARIRAAVPTLKNLKNARVVVGSHQSRPGKDDFISLQAHALALRKYFGWRVKFIDDVIGPKAREEIRKVEKGEVLVLDNLRLCSEENIEAPPEKLVKTIFIRRLAPLFDLFVNDAFAAAHRSQASIVGFAELMPAVAGKTMERELKALEATLEKPKRPCVYVLGGIKVADRIPVLENVLGSGEADKILLGGLLAEFFLYAAGHRLGQKNEEKLKGFLPLLDRAKKLLEAYKDRLILPSDLAVLENGERVEKRVKEFPLNSVAQDIGVDTLVSYRGIIKKAGTVIADGPVGVFEKEPFSLGTREILEAMAESNAFTVVGGGHVGGAAELMGLKEKIGHISTGGGAMLAYLSGQKLPALEALKKAARRFKGKT